MVPAEDSGVDGMGPAALLVILVLGASSALLLGAALTRHWDSETELETQRYASALGDVIGSEFNRLHLLLRRRAQFWASEAMSNDLGAWREHVEIVLTENPAVLAVLRADPNWELAGSPEGKQILREILPESRRREVDADGEFVIGPMRAADGRDVIGIQLRTSSGTDERTIFTLIDAGRFIKDLLDERALGFALAVSAGGHEVYRRDAPNGQQVRSALHKSESIVLPSGEPWRLDVTPAGDIPWASREQAPAIALALGIFVSGLIAAALHFATLSWRRDRMLRRANRALEEQVVDTRHGRDELRELSETLERRVRERTDQLNETIVELETFNYSVSHDLRGPLGAVINFAAILQEDYGEELDAMGRDFLARIIGSASSAVAMMDALLAYSRSGRAELQIVHLDVQRLVREVCEELEASFPELRCAVKLDDLPSVFADESMMRFIFFNLISNACKFAGKGESPQIEVGGNSASNEAVFFVRDHGIGFDMRYQDKLFKVFERLHASDGYEGHGVGLAIVARMARRHGGRVWAQGAVGKGATFYFTVATPGSDTAEVERDGRFAH